MYNGEIYKQFPYDTSDKKIMNSVKELNIQVLLENGCMVSIMPQSYYDKHKILHKYQEMPSFDYMVIYTGDGDIKAHFLIVIPLMMKQVTNSNTY